MLSRDGSTLFYCTANAIRAWDLGSGLRRMLKSVPSPGLAALLGDDMLHCTANGRSMVISVEDGRILWEGDPAASFRVAGDHYYASLPVGLNQLLLFGQTGAEPWALNTADFNDGVCQFLKERNAVVTAVTGRETVLSCYDLDTGQRSSVLPLPRQAPPVADAGPDGRIWLLAHDEHYGWPVLYRWDPDSLPTGDTQLYTLPHFIARTPDLEGLARCRDYAAEIGSRYGIRVLIGEEAAAAQPWDYDFEPEHLVPFLEQELRLLDESLSHYPQSILDDTMSHFSSLTICLVRSITGTAESGSVETANGLQFFSGTDVYLALAVGPHSDHPLYHELFHVMETHLLGGSAAFDQWDNLNPPGFTYDYDYSGSAGRAFKTYLSGEQRAFIDSYSTSFPKEDRARVMEYAMTPGNEELFQHKILQAKLEVLCKAIRQAYGLKKSPESYLWEQYLNTPLTYSR